MTVATWNGALIAQSDKTVVLKATTTSLPNPSIHNILDRARRRVGVLGRVLRTTIRLSSMEKLTMTRHGIMPNPRMRLRQLKAMSRFGKM